MKRKITTRTPEPFQQINSRKRKLPTIHTFYSRNDREINTKTNTKPERLKEENIHQPINFATLNQGWPLKDLTQACQRKEKKKRLHHHGEKTSQVRYSGGFPFAFPKQKK